MFKSLFTVALIFAFAMYSGCKKQEEAPPQPAPQPQVQPPAPKVEQPVEKPKTPEEERQAKIEKQRERTKEIYALGRSDKPEDLKKLEEIMTGTNFEVWERSTAIRALGGQKKDSLLETLKKLANDQSLPIQTEAVITLFKWGEGKFALPIMKTLATEKGIPMRRAFLKGFENGKYLYEEGAKEFFSSLLANENAYVKLDAALGLLQIGEEKTSLPIFKTIIEKEEKYFVRLAAVNYLGSMKDDPKVKALLEKATKDENPEVSKRAKVLLGLEEQPAPPPQGAAQPAPVQTPPAQEKQADSKKQ
jgi:HEAT repeat protein